MVRELAYRSAERAARFGADAMLKIEKAKTLEKAKEIAKETRIQIWVAEAVGEGLTWWRDDGDDAQLRRGTA